MSHDAEVLNRLIARLHGAARSCRAAGSDGVVGFKEMLDGAAAAHERAAEGLAAVLRAMGEEPAAGPAVAGGARLGAALAEGEAGAAAAIARFEAELLAEVQAALDDPSTSGPARDAVLRARDSVEAARDRALRLLDAAGG